jgi:CheY-like chemotaxis protein
MSSEKRILVVDDSATNNILVENILKEQGYDITIITNGKDALKHVATNETDVMLLDIMMPKMNGYEVLEQLKKDKKLTEIPVIVITAKVESKDVKKALELGAVDYIKKPIDIDELLSRVDMAIKLKESNDNSNYYKQINEDLIFMMLNIREKSFDMLDNQSSKDSFKSRLEYLADMDNKISDIVDLLSNVISKSDKILLWDILDKNLSVIEKIAEQKGIIIERNLTTNLTIRCDERFINFCIFNLLSSSIVQSQGNSKIIVSSYANNEEIILKIYDSETSYAFSDKQISYFNKLRELFTKNNCMFEVSENSIAGKEFSIIF